MSLAKLEAITSKLRDGSLTLTADVAQSLDKATGKRLAKEEKAALMALEKDLEAGKIKTDKLGEHFFLDGLEKKDESRFAHGLKEAQSYGSIGQTISTALAGIVGGGAGLMSGGPTMAAAGAATGAFVGLASGRLIGSIIGFVKGLIED